MTWAQVVFDLLVGNALLLGAWCYVRLYKRVERLEREVFGKSPEEMEP
jgi:hypothetical protein